MATASSFTGERTCGPFHGPADRQLRQSLLRGTGDGRRVPPRQLAREGSTAGAREVPVLPRRRQLPDAVDRHTERRKRGMVPTAEHRHGGPQASVCPERAKRAGQIQLCGQPGGRPTLFARPGRPTRPVFPRRSRDPTQQADERGPGSRGTLRTGSRRDGQNLARLVVRGGGSARDLHAATRLDRCHSSLNARSEAARTGSRHCCPRGDFHADNEMGIAQADCSLRGGRPDRAPTGRRPHKGIAVGPFPPTGRAGRPGHPTQPGVQPGRMGTAERGDDEGWRWTDIGGKVRQASRLSGRQGAHGSESKKSEMDGRHMRTKSFLQFAAILFSGILSVTSAAAATNDVRINVMITGKEIALPPDRRSTLVSNVVSFVHSASVNLTQWSANQEAGEKEWERLMKSDSFIHITFTKPATI